jgi:hypothetical protein
MWMFYGSLFVLFELFPLAIMLSVLQFTDSDYSFGIFKLFLYNLIFSLIYAQTGYQACNLLSRTLIICLMKACLFELSSVAR